MRTARAVIPVALLAAAFLAGCNNQNNNAGTNTTTGAGATTAAAATPNGVADLPPADILAKAKAAMLAAKSFKVKGDINSDGQKITIDLSAKGGDAGGTITLGGAELQIRKVGADIFLKGSPQFWKTVDPQKGETIATLLGERWAKASTSTPGVGSLAEFADPKNFSDELLDAGGNVTKADTKTINGIEAVGLKSGTGDGTLYIATVGEPYPLRVEGPNNEGAVDFSGFNSDVTIEAPPAAEVVDFSQLAGGA